MIETGCSVLSKRKSQGILKPYSCSEQNKMASKISTQLAADSSASWSLPNEDKFMYFRKKGFLVYIFC